MKRFLSLSVIALAILPPLAGADVRSAPVGPPAVEVHYDGKALTATGVAHPGPLKLSLTGSAAANVAVIELSSNRVMAAAAVKPGRTYTTTITARAGDYVARELTEGAKTTFAVSGEATTAALPHADAHVVVNQKRLVAPERLPAIGVVRVDNRSHDDQHVLAIRVPRGRSTDEAAKLVRKGRVGQAGAATELVGLVSPATSNRVAVRLTPGRYLLVSGLGGTPEIATAKVTG
jgi:hypothetical protein